MVDDGSRILAGRYEVGELIGRGGMAEVHIGHDTRLGRTVAIKILRSDLARDPSFQNRFRREAQAAASLNHPAIVAVYDTGEDVTTEATGVVGHVPFIVMEYVEGHTVRDILRDGHAVPIEEAVEISAGVLSALEYSHHAGIVHRDIKPANVMLTPTGAVKVMDFGIARAVADSAATMTQTQAVIGTAQYLSPEQARGETVDARSDLYSAGCLLFELLTGRPPFVGDSPVSVAYQHVREPAPVPSTLASDVPDSLDRITLKALAKERDSRYSTAAEFRSDLEAVLRGGAVAAPAVGTIVPAVAAAEATQVLAPQAPVTQALPPTQPPWGTTGLTEVATVAEDEEERKRPWLIWLLVAIAVLAVAGIVALLIANANKEKEPETVKVPTLVGKTETEAKNLLQGLDLVYKGAEGTSDSIPEGSVISSNPAEGATATVGDTVTVTISTGTGKVDVPDVTGKTAAEAEEILTGLGLTVDPNRDNDDNPKFDEGQVTKTDPAADESVNSGTSVKLSVSTGLVDVPSFKGKDQKEATDKLSNDLNMRPVVEKVETADADPGTVVSQDRDGLLKQGTTITLQVATAPTTATVPDDLRGMSYDDAVAALKDAGITGTPTRVDEPSDDTPAGDVLYTNPDGGATVGVDDVIEIHVSSGPAAPDPNATTPAPPAP
ncbi:Stk1 family PASTA domain-containing Ser/Thr kinase [Cellulomonas sp. PhB150]|uniref:Stk1 family PASTA domain-containing Ser/Thr kinase n=1 Tax=Cellulomonas sp. PhB150 TaxID=2485188 RepID=UPI000F4632A5|nr:Stk1 family PASTA domain-containing Ser/Thr kinase [Cellulomonas sp. PhB150]ROS26207.1 serine/threonine-protein kinase [Cellulomonas sp. PhB150]